MKLKINAVSKRSNVINLGLLGLGTVGSGVYKTLTDQAAALEKKTGFRFVIKKICVRSGSKKRNVSVPKSLLTTNPMDLVNDASIDILVELIGGIHPAKEILEKALANGKHVVTANKALLAEQGDSIFASALEHSRQLGFEASVCGGIPILQSLKNGLVSNEITHFFGIVNGTCNYILTEMSKGGLDFSSALKDAQKLGYAEKNPTLDVNGTDSAHKLAILARLAFGKRINFKSIYVEGISKISAEDIEYFKELGYGVKLLAIGKKTAAGVELRVHPTLLPLDHPLSSVRGPYNAVFVHGSQVDDLLFYGRGAGSLPTASSVVSDIVDIAKKCFHGSYSKPHQDPPVSEKARIFPVDNIVSKYYLRFQVKDRPGVLGRIAQNLGAHNISILSVHQKEAQGSGAVPVVILTYAAREKDLRAALAKIDRMQDVHQKTVVIRVEK